MRISDWSSDVCSSDLVAVYEAICDCTGHCYGGDLHFIGKCLKRNRTWKYYRITSMGAGRPAGNAKRLILQIPPTRYRWAGCHLETTRLPMWPMRWKRHRGPKQTGRP